MPAAVKVNELTKFLGEVENEFCLTLRFRFDDMFVQLPAAWVFLVKDFVCFIHWQLPPAGGLIEQGLLLELLDTVRANDLAAMVDHVIFDLAAEGAAGCILL